MPDNHSARQSQLASSDLKAFITLVCVLSAQRHTHKATSMTNNTLNLMSPDMPWYIHLFSIHHYRMTLMSCKGLTAISLLISWVKGPYRITDPDAFWPFMLKHYYATLSVNSFVSLSFCLILDIMSFNNSQTPV